MRPLLSAAVFVLHGCTASSSQPLSAGWLVGGWLEMSAGARYPLGCESDMPIHYEVDGSYSLLEEVGTWRLDGNVLTEVATEATEAGDPAEVEIGRPYLSTIQRLSSDRFLKRLADGQVMEFRRCPEIK